MKKTITIIHKDESFKFSAINENGEPLRKGETFVLISESMRVVLNKMTEKKIKLDDWNNAMIEMIKHLHSN